MDPSEIKLESIDLMFQYESQSRIIDELNHDAAILIAKCYLKLYLQQQEVLTQMGFEGLTGDDEGANIL